MILNSDSYSWGQLSSRFQIECHVDCLQREGGKCTVRTDIWKIFSALSLLLLWQDWTFFSIFLISISGCCKLKVVFVELVVVFTQRPTLQLYHRIFFKENPFMVARPTLSLLIIKHKIQEYRTIWGQYQVINFKYFNHFLFQNIFHEYPNPNNFPKDPPCFPTPCYSGSCRRIPTFLSKQDIKFLFCPALVLIVIDCE